MRSASARPRFEDRLPASARAAAALVLVVLLGCPSGSGVPIAFHEVEGDRDRRVAFVLHELLADAPPPSPILDAHFAEERLGDGVLGPSDVRTFCALEVGPADVGRWLAVLTPSESPAGQAAPGEPLAWWPSEDALAGFAVYRPDVFPGALQGWVAVDEAGAKIYLYGFST